MNLSAASRAPQSPEGHRWHSEVTRCFDEGHRSFIKTHESSERTTLVSPLPLASHPSAVSVRVFLARTRVRPVVVDSINGVIGRWSRPHVREEHSKVISPAVADSDPATTVVSPRLVPRIQAAVLHGRPDFVLGRVPQAVRPETSACDLSVQASATRGVAIHQLSATGQGDSATGALAAPVSARFRSLRPLSQTKHRQATKRLTSQIEARVHRADLSERHNHQFTSENATAHAITARCEE